VKEVVIAQGLQEDALLKDELDDTCKVWVSLILAWSASHLSMQIRVRDKQTDERNSVPHKL
jgi:hypothetical protein